MGRIRPRTLRDGTKRYQALVLDASGREHVKTFAKQRDARLWLADREAAFLRDDLLAPNVALREMTFAELAQRWQTTWGNLQPNTTRRYGELLDLWMLPYWRRTPLRLITHERVQEYVNEVAAGNVRGVRVGLGTRKRPPSPTTVHRVHAALSTMLTEGVRCGAMKTNPAKHCRLPRKVKHTPVILTLGDLDALYAAFPPPFDLAVRLAASTGLRAGELWGLQVRDLDTASDGRPILRVERALKDLNGHLKLGPTKTHAAREITLPVALASSLAAHRSGRGMAPMFAVSNGAPVRHNLWMCRVWRPAVAATFQTLPRRKLRFHDLRHTHASLLLAAGHPPTAVAARLGHANVTTTLSIYAHALPGSDAALAAMFDPRAA